MRCLFKVVLSFTFKTVNEKEFISFSLNKRKGKSCKLFFFLTMNLIFI